MTRGVEYEKITEAETRVSHIFLPWLRQFHSSGVVHGERVW